MARYSMCMNIGRLQYCQDINSSNLIYIVNAILVKIPASYYYFFKYFLNIFIGV